MYYKKYKSIVQVCIVQVNNDEIFGFFKELKLYILSCHLTYVIIYY